MNLKARLGSCSGQHRTCSHLYEDLTSRHSNIMTTTSTLQIWNCQPLDENLQSIPQLSHRVCDFPIGYRIAAHQQTRTEAADRGRLWPSATCRGSFFSTSAIEAYADTLGEHRTRRCPSSGLRPPSPPNAKCVRGRREKLRVCSSPLPGLERSQATAGNRMPHDAFAKQRKAAN